MMPELRFWYKLAGYLGMSVARCQQEVSYREFAHWVALYEVEPFGHDRDEYHNAILASVSADAMRTKGRPTDPNKFVIFANREAERAPLDVNSMVASLKMLAASAEG